MHCTLSNCLTTSKIYVYLIPACLRVRTLLLEYFRPLPCRRHLVNEHDREDLDEVSNRRLTSMALDVARGLSYLAELKYVHRDVACR